MIKLTKNQITTTLVILATTLLVSILVIFAIENWPTDTSSHVTDQDNAAEQIQAEPTVTEILGASVKANAAQLIDVRTVEEYTESHADGALNIPLEIIESGDYSGFSKSTPIYLYCRTGRRAEIAKTLLEQAGFTDITNIVGLSDWQLDGGKVCASINKDC